MLDLTRFVNMLQACEQARGNRFTNWESEFIADLREKYDGREDQLDLGMTSWVPTRNQFNTLHGIWSKL